VINAAVFFVLFELSEVHSLCANIASDRATGAFRSFMLDEVSHSVSAVTMLALTFCHHNILDDDVKQQEEANHEVKGIGGNEGILVTNLLEVVRGVKARKHSCAIHFVEINAEGDNSHDGSCEVQSTEDIGNGLAAERQEVGKDGDNANGNTEQARNGH